MSRKPISVVRSWFSSWWAALGIAAAAISGFNLVRRLLDLSPGELWSATADMYRAIVYRSIDLVVGFTPFHLDNFQKDWLSLWILAGAAVWRAYAVRAPARLDTEGNKNGFKRALWFAIASPLCVLAWPLFLSSAFMEPIAVRIHPVGQATATTLGQRYFVDDMQYRLLSSLHEDVVVKREIDLRVSLVIQVLSLVIAIMAFALINAAW